jgi:K+-sensing histidine kinase KdpD
MDTFLERRRTAVLVVCVGLPLVWCAIAAGIGDHLTTAASSLVLVLLVVAAAATGDRVAGLLAAVSGAVWFDFFLTAPTRSFAIDSADDVEIVVLLVLVGVAVTEIALWGRRQEASASARAGYLDGVSSTSRIVAGQLAPTDLVEHVTTDITELLGVDACRFVAGDTPAGNRPTLRPDGSVTVHGVTVNVDRDGLPTMDEIVLPARHHGVTLGTFLITASTSVTRPTLEQREVAVLLADQVRADLASRPHQDV